MKREDLEKLGLTAEALEKAGLNGDVINQIMTLHGKDIEGHKSKLTEATSTADALKKQLADANGQIEGFKDLKPDELKKAADDWKAKFETAQAEHAAHLVGMAFDKDFEDALSGAKVKYTNEVKARLKVDELKDKSGKFIAERFNEQIEGIKKSSIDLFAEAEDTPRIVTGGNNQTVVTDAFAEAAFRGAKLPQAANKQG